MAERDERKVRRTPGGAARGGLAAALGVVFGAVAGVVLETVVRVIAAVAHGTFGRSEPRTLESTRADNGTVRGARATRAAKHEPQPLRPGWSRPPPEHLVRPSYWPIALALGISFLFWGFVSSWIISVIGLLITIVSLANWIAELRHDS
jgi:hypothetical protein